MEDGNQLVMLDDLGTFIMNPTAFEGSMVVIGLQMNALVRNHKCQGKLMGPFPHWGYFKLHSCLMLPP